MPSGIGNLTKSKNLQCFFVLFPELPMSINLFDADNYRKANPDVNGLSDKQVWSHFKNFGLENGLEFSSLVDLDLYRASYNDLTELSNREAYEHLANYGISQGRKFSPFVDLQHYRKNNSDLVNLSNEELFEHLKDSGIAEGRSFSPFFDVEYYLAQNPDVAQAVGNNYEEAFNHFVFEGLNEGDSFSRGFDPEFYKNAHADLAASSLDNEELLEHFVIIGLNEGRASAPGFDVKNYLENNPELKQAGLSYSQAYEHFVTQGNGNEIVTGQYIEIDYAGNTLDSAVPITLDSGIFGLRGSIGNSDSDDFYSLNLSNPNNKLELIINGLTEDVDLELLNSSGEIITRAASNSNIDEFLTADNLENGAYYIRVFQGIESADTNYDFNLSVTPTEVEPNVIVLNESTDSAASGESFNRQYGSNFTSSNPLINKVFDLVNEYRSEKNLQPLTLNLELSLAAEKHSEDMAINDFFSHEGSNGSKLSDRTITAGYESSYVGENIAAGYITAEEVVKAWIDSPEHHKNIVNPNYQEIGLGYYYLENDTGESNYKRYWTQNFGGIVST